MRESLKAARKAAGLTQKQVAAEARIDRISYGHIEAARRNPSLPVALRIARALGADPRIIFADLDAASGQ